jgi:diguanylate cyclase (GGDEF)-like protein
MRRSSSPNAGAGKLSVSAGVSSLTQATTGEQLIEHADSALYEAKRAGRNRTVLFTPAHTRSLT